MSQAIRGRHAGPARVRFRRGFTLVELLVVIAIIGVLIALLLPAVQAAREAARRLQCANHIGELAQGCMTHMDAHGHLPTGGWLWTWVGDPDWLHPGKPTGQKRGFGLDQCGGWIFNVLPYIEQGAIRDMAVGQTNPAFKRLALTNMTTKAIPILYCPSRRPAEPTAPKSYYNDNILNADMPASGKVAKTDYAACCGDPINVDASQIAPDNGQHSNPDDPANWTPLNVMETMNGVCFQRSLITPADISDGTSCTYLIGEKSLRPEAYDGYVGGDLDDKGDNESCYGGYNRDFHRSTYFVMVQDREGVYMQYAFGSCHPTGVNMSFCDGSVRQIGYEVNPRTHRYLGVRDDGLTLNGTY
ncbi:MAG: DUF1559 domain-containing protein [Pirellulales bacterium]|nr:DUF1559 domain-containing protein [Pirellulales bacterium]